MRVVLFIALLLLLALPFAWRQSEPVRTADDVLVVITPHNGAIRHEFGRAFERWYQQRTGRSIRVDWRIVGGTADIARYLESTYAAAFERAWTNKGGVWNAAVQAGLQNPNTRADVAPDVWAARQAFLASDTSCGIDVFFGGDTYQAGREASAGRLVDAGLIRRHPAWFTEAVIPQRHRGATFWDTAGRWYGTALSSYGIIYNRVNLSGLEGVAAPQSWSDLADPAFIGQVGLANPAKSGSVCEAFEAMIQQQIAARMVAVAGLAHGGAESSGYPVERTAAAIREGWIAGLQLIQRLGANARYFTDASQKPPLDVANGDCAAGLCIDFYGRQQQEAVRARGDRERIGYVTPRGGSAATADPIGLLRGAPNRPAAELFIEFVLAPEGQRIWGLKVGAPGGPERFALRRMPIRRDFYAPERPDERSDPEDNPYSEDAAAFTYHPEWTGELFREIGFITRVLCMDNHDALVDAWQAIHAAPAERQAPALAVLQDVERVGYDRARDEIRRRLNAKDRVEEVRLATELNAHFRAQYQRAARIARGEE